MLFALGFVFMFTIGGLLNNHLALPLLSDKTTICWEVLTIMILEFYLISVIKHNFEQSAGNQRIFYNHNVEPFGSSETTRSTRSSFREDIVQIKKCSLIFNSHFCYRTIFLRVHSHNSILLFFQ